MLDFKNYIRSLITNPNPVLFEIGCATGEDTLEFIEAFKDVDFTLYCFEPDQRNICEFKNKIKDKRVYLYENAVGNVSGMTKFHTSLGKNNLSSSLKQPGKDLYKTWPELFKDKDDFLEGRISCIRLDDFCRALRIDRIDFIWMDVQGSEDLVIEGGKNMFYDKIECLYTEYSNAEIYRGESNLEEILALLPTYEIVMNFPNRTGDMLGGDILLINKNFKEI